MSSSQRSLRSRAASRRDNDASDRTLSEALEEAAAAGQQAAWQDNASAHPSPIAEGDDAELAWGGSDGGYGLEHDAEDAEEAAPPATFGGSLQEEWDNPKSDSSSESDFSGSEDVDDLSGASGRAPPSQTPPPSLVALTQKARSAVARFRPYVTALIGNKVAPLAAAYGPVRRAEIIKGAVAYFDLHLADKASPDELHRGKWRASRPPLFP